MGSRAFRRNMLRRLVEAGKVETVESQGRRLT